MPVSDEIFVPLTVLFRSYAKSPKKGDYLAKQRKQIKILVDSLWEQTVEFYFVLKPRNHMEARKIINMHKEELTEDADKAVIDALAEVLGQYDVLIATSYHEIAAKLTPLFAVALRRLCLCLAQHPSHVSKQAALKLVAGVSKVGT